MAGHNKWSKVKHRKAVVDSRRSKVWSKCAKAIMVAAKHGGGDPESNLSLRYAIDEARYANMPRDTIERAIKKGAGEIGGEDWVTIRYEGYGPGGVAIVVDALTNNRTRTATDVRNAFGDNGGNLGTTGCVSFMFSTVGQIVVDVKPGFSGDRLMELAIESGASDVQEGAPAPGGDDEPEPWTLTADVPDFIRVKQAVEKAGFAVAQAGITLVPQNTVAVRGEHAKSIMTLIDELEDNDDVQKVYTNADIPDDVLAAM